MNKISYISNLDLLEGIPPSEIMSLCTNVNDTTHPSRYVLYIRSDILDSMFLVKTGEVKLYHMQDGKKSVFDTLGPGDVFGNFSTEPIRSMHFAEVEAGTRICTIPIDEFLKIVAAHPEKIMKTIKVLADRLSDYERKISMSGAPAKEKVLSELSRYQSKKKSSFLERIVSVPVEKASIKLTHQEIANLTGLNRVTVTRALRELLTEESLSMSDDGGYKLSEV
ncbi:Crp/Fnr family transcriptional regulator [Candidatus Uhrbacteria bacterium]|jgi:CRP-like cAMP-binding protein|nr:Crp/Fnr family transcriptional regulator [Candidatus Uhrbacteria bacterium]